MKNILLPTDFSKNAYTAIEYAVQLFKDEACTFYLLHAITPGAYGIESVDDGPSTKVIEHVTRRNAEDRLKEIVKEMKTKHASDKHIFKTLVSFNVLVREIKSIVNELAVDVIVMGTKGARGAKEVFIGTNTMDTIKKIRVPIIAVPEEFTFKKPQEVLFPTDLKFSMENKYLAFLRFLIAKHSSRLNVMNIYIGKSLELTQEKVKRELAAYFKNNNYLFHELEYMSVTEAVEHYQIKHKMDFLVMINNKHSFFENLLFKSAIKEIVYHTHIPFMVIPSMELMNS